MPAIQRRVEYGRYLAKAELTESGVYIKGQVPEDYSGSFIAEIDVCYAVIATDISGRIVLTTYNPPDLLDKEDKKGAAVILPSGHSAGGTSTVRENTNAEVTEKILLQWDENTHIAPPLKTQADNMWSVAKRELGQWYV